jgi:hypothetical protein
MTESTKEILEGVGWTTVNEDGTYEVLDNNEKPVTDKLTILLRLQEGYQRYTFWSKGVGGAKAHDTCRAALYKKCYRNCFESVFDPATVDVLQPFECTPDELMVGYQQMMDGHYDK